MKKFFVLLFSAACGAIMLGTSCAERPREAVRQPDREADSLRAVIAAKDSLMNAVFADINAISENLAQIRSRENIITLAARGEGPQRPTEEIADDIAAIDRLLKENRTKIASLQRTSAALQKADRRIEGLDRTIRDLNDRLTEKSTEIAHLRTELEERTTEVTHLTQQVAERGAKIENLNSEKVELENRLNTVYYIVGQEKELRDAQIVDKQGFLGRTLTANGKGRLESFTQSDARLLTEIAVGRKRAVLVTPHPEGSYTLETAPDGKTVERLRIIDPDRFWESSRVLIVSYK